MTAKRYDVITADIIQPTYAGAGYLYSAEYYQLARNSLKKDGIMLQWVSSWSPTKQKLIMRTFQSVFPYTTLWSGKGLLVGTKRPLQIDRVAFERKLQDEVTRQAFAAAGLANFQALLSTFTTGPDELRQFAGPGPVLTDDQPRLEYFRSLSSDDIGTTIPIVHTDPSQYIKH